MFVVATKRGTFEIRESRSTPAGPRSQTLATFRQLTDDVVEKASARAAKPIDPDRLREAALRAGASLAQMPADRAARELIAELGKGGGPEPKLRRLLTDMLGDDPKAAVVPADPSRAVAEWMAATPEERGKNLVDLLLLADALPSNGRVDQPLRFPRLDLAHESAA
jgi:hypothetical protein